MKKSIFWRLTLLTVALVTASFLTVGIIAQYMKLKMTGELVLAYFITAAVAILLSYTTSFFISQRIAERINKFSLENVKEDLPYEELKPFADKLSEREKEFSSSIESLRALHEDQDAMRREFTANVSHELKTPLTSISGYAEIIKNGIAKEEDVTRFAGRIYEESQRMTTLVGDIIKLSQLDEKAVEAVVEPIDLYDACAAVLSHLEQPAVEKNVTLSLTGDHFIVNSVEEIVEEIIFNVCDNAIKYNKEDGKVDVNLRQCVDGIELTVSDTGIGIPEEALPRIFERFYRVDKSHSREIGGTGLGLSIVKHAAKYLGVSVSVNSKVGEGTEFKILF